MTMRLASLLGTSHARAIPTRRYYVDADEIGGKRRIFAEILQFRQVVRRPDGVLQGWHETCS